MAKIVIAGEAVVVTSELKMEDIRMVSKYRPKALVLKGGDDGKEDIFAIGVTAGKGSISAFGASFGRATGDGFAQVTVTFEGKEVPEKLEDWALDTLGGAIMSLHALEVTLPEVIAEIEAEKAAVKEAITVM